MRGARGRTRAAAVRLPALPRGTDRVRQLPLGERLADLHYCTSCHRAGLIGQQQVPRLAGQDFDYLLKLLRSFKARTATDLDGLMTMSAQPLTEADIENLVHYIATLPAASSP